MKKRHFVIAGVVAAAGIAAKKRREASSSDRGTTSKPSTAWADEKARTRWDDEGGAIGRTPGKG